MVITCVHTWTKFCHTRSYPKIQDNIASRSLQDLPCKQLSLQFSGTVFNCFNCFKAIFTKEPRSNTKTSSAMCNEQALLLLTLTRAFSNKDKRTVTTGCADAQWGSIWRKPQQWCLCQKTNGASCWGGKWRSALNGSYSWKGHAWLWEQISSMIQKYTVYLPENQQPWVMSYTVLFSRHLSSVITIS